MITLIEMSSKNSLENKRSCVSESQVSKVFTKALRSKKNEAADNQLSEVGWNREI
ncbi:hypothetical protein [Vagococcus sp.]|uniref:hypothetical protein n=1 Tax=Vagococcus sp. TaxID=1933889 RepID=UPI003F9C116D